MNRIIALLKRIRPSQILMAFMAGIFLVVSTACSSDQVQAQTPNGLRQEVPAGLEAVPGKQNPRPEVPERAETNTFKGSSMNEFSDVDPRTPETTGGKAKDLVENAQKNLDKGADNPDKLIRNIRQGTPLGERVRRLGEDVGSSAEDVKEGVSKGIKRGAENAKDNTLDAATSLKKGAGRTAEDAKQAARNAAENTRSVGRDTSELAQDKANQAGKSTTNFVQDKVNQFVKGTQEAAKKANNAIDNTVD